MPTQMSKSATEAAWRDRDRASLKGTIDYSSAKALPDIWPIAAQQFGQIVALRDPNSKPVAELTYRELWQQIQQFAAGLQALGLQPSTDEELPRIALFADNSPRWMIADQGTMAAGAANAVRGAQADPNELLYILENSGSIALILQDAALLDKLRSRLSEFPLQFIILLSDETVESEGLPKLVSFPQVMELGSQHSLQRPNLQPHMLATLLYTSGTTGKPKGVILTHSNLLHQVTNTGVVLQPKPGARVLSILPTWHSYERTGEYFLLSRGCSQVYTNLRSVKRDLKAYQPDYMVGVPRLWESIYEGVRKQLQEQPARKQQLVNTLLSASYQYIASRRVSQGLTLTPNPPEASKRWLARLRSWLFWPLHALANQLVYKQIRAAIGGSPTLMSGGGSLAMHLEDFFETIGIPIVVGYGLTETSPILTGRRTWCNLRGSSGRPLPDTEIRIVDPETRQPLPPGSRGLVLARGPQIMRGYYHNPEATRKAIDEDGWFDTGDLGWLTANQDIVLTGRAKDTIVLTNGENIEPQPIEDACIRSPYIDQIMLVGQDQRCLGALIVPNSEALAQWASAQNCILQLPEEASLPLPESAAAQGTSSAQPIDIRDRRIEDLFRKELNRQVKDRPSYRPDDRIGPFQLLLEPFSMDNGMMTQTLKIRRPVVRERYRDMIDGMFH